MAIYTDAYYRAKADELVRKCGFASPPVDVRGAADTLGLEIVELSLPSWFFGVLMRVEGDPYIVINKMMPDHRKNFTIGHEIAHHILHKDDLCHMKNSKRSYFHREADIFAAELCMPSEMVRLEAKKWFNDYRYLAGLFGVSEIAMVRKMQELGLLRQGHFDCQTT